eukprot:403354803
MNGYQHQHLGPPSSQQNIYREKSGSPLRRKEYSEIGQSTQQHAGLRQPQIMSPVRDEEELYEKRRQEELRKQLYSGVSSQARDPYVDSGSLALSNSLARSNGFGVDPYVSGKSNQSVPERDRPSAQHFTLGPQQQINSNSNSSASDAIIQPPPHIKDHINAIQNDNSSLMRRLNLVMQEHDRVKREKEDIYQRLKQSAIEASELKKLLQCEDNVDKVNNYMNEDLVYERDRNHKVKQQIKDLDLYRTDLINELRKLQDRSDEISKSNQDLGFQLNQKASKFQDLEKEMYFTNEKVKQLNNTIEGLKQDLIIEGHEKGDLDRIVIKLQQERNDLLSKLDLLNRKYDECVREISHDRSEMEAHNRKHAKLITAKIMFQQLDLAHRNTFLYSIQKIKEYCDFDQKTHQKLGVFAKILEKTGHYRMRIGLRQWFSLAIMPIKMKKQSELLAEQANNVHLKLKMFVAWKSAYDRRIRDYELKNQAIQRIWNIQCKDLNQELKRSFIIWKERLDKFNLQKTKVKKLIWKLYFNKLSGAFNNWQNHVTNIDAQVRLNLLSKQFSQKQYLTILFHNFKYQVTENKRKRINILFHCLKAWKDHLTYQKFLMATSVQAMHFRRNCDSTILKQCFDAFRIHKETEKFLKINHILQEEELPMIESITAQNEDIEVQNKFKAKQRACQSVKKMMSKQLYEYFELWKQHSEEYKETLRTTIKDKIIKVYMEKIRKAFTYWKALNDQNKLTAQSMLIQEYQFDSTNLQNDILDLQKDISNRKEQLDCSQSKHTLKCVTSYQRRMKQLALGRWRDQIASMNIKENGADTIISRMRKRFLRQAFDLYLSKIKSKKQDQINEERCTQYKKTRDERLKRQVLNSWTIFIDNHIKAKRYWNRMYLRLDLGMKQIALKKWQEWSQKQNEIQLTDCQNKVVSNIEELNHQIGNLHQNDTDQQIAISNLKDQMTTQARRIISNAFARFYYVSETRGFEKWKEYVDFEKRKEKIFKKYIDHWRKHQFYMVKAALQNWIQNCKIDEKKDLLKKEELRVKDAQFQLDSQQRNYTGDNHQLLDELEKTKEQQRIYNQRLQKSVAMIVNRVDKNDFMCQKRYILTQWRQYVKREVNFINCVEKVMTKSLWNSALMKIRQFSREADNHNNMSEKLNRFRMKFWKRTCGNAFSVWRSGQFKMITSTLEEVESETNQTIQDYENKKAVFKETNQNRSERIIKKHNLRNLFQGWKNVTQLLKFQNAKDDQYNASAIEFQKKMALYKWNCRKNSTKLARIRTKKLKVKVLQIRLRQYFNAIKNQFYNAKELCQRLSNLAKIHDHQCLKLSFNGIHSFSNAKNYVHQTRKQNASNDIQSILTKLVMRRKQQYLNDLRVRSLLSKKEHMIKSFTILQCVGNKLRHFFLKWKETANERTVALEMHEEGPIREEVFEANIQLKNIKEFMSKEGYDPKDIQEALKKEKDRQKTLLLKGVKRFQHYNEELYTLPMMLDRWKQFVHLRKLFRYWLNFADKRSEYVKCDLHHAFDKWKSYHGDQRSALTNLSKKQLEDRTVKNNKQLDNIAEQIDEKENTLDHMNNQREALVENYVKGQKLALSLWLNYRKRQLHQGFLKWCKITKTMKNMETLDNLRKNMELIERLKDKIAHFENENDTLANENEDLRQFSLDGYEIAKNVQVLTAEREKLSVDLADKSQVIRKLLDENEKLTGKLRYAQEEAQNLIKSTMAGSSGFKTGGKDNRSPLQRGFY